MRADVIDPTIEEEVCPFKQEAMLSNPNMHILYAGKFPTGPMIDPIT